MAAPLPNAKADRKAKTISVLWGCLVHVWVNFYGDLIKTGGDSLVEKHTLHQEMKLLDGSDID